MHSSTANRSSSTRAAIACALVIACGTLGCASRPPAKDASSAVTLFDGPRRNFEFTTIDGKPLTTATLAGRVSVIGFIATYDVASQAQARFLASIARRQVPRVNVAVLVLEPAENLPLVEAFVKTLDLPYPAALADAATISGRGPFAGLHHVPAVVILDAEGRERWRHVGLAVDKDIALAARAVAQRE